MPTRQRPFPVRALLAMAFVASTALGGCAANDSSPSPSSSEPSSPTVDRTNEPTTAAQESENSVLIVHFSRAGENYWEGGRRDLDIGNTKILAEMIAERIDADIYEIVPAEPYPDDYDAVVDRNRAEQDADARPGIAGDLPDVSGYDTVFIGSPVWSQQAPMIMYTFVESVDLTNKTILPFVTYAVSGMSGVDDDYRAALTNSTVVDGLAIRGEDVSVAGAEVDQWLAGQRTISSMTSGTIGPCHGQLLTNRR